MDPNIDPERRIKALWHVWLRTYFSGTPFDTRAAGGGVEQRTFRRCDLAWQEADATDAPDPDGNRVVQRRPVIHGVLVSDSNRPYQHSDLFTGGEVQRTIQFTVKVPSNVTGTAEMSADDPVALVATVADNLAWLVQGSERAALAAHGITNIMLRSGPISISSSRWLARLLVVSMTSRRLTARG